MAGSAFCAFVDALRAATPALPSSDLPTLQAFSQLARAFPAQLQPAVGLEEPQGRPNGEQARPQDDSTDQSAVDGWAVEEEVQSAEVATDEKAESSSQDDSAVAADAAQQSVAVSQADSQSENKADGKAAVEADAKAEPQGESKVDDQSASQEDAEAASRTGGTADAKAASKADSASGAKADGQASAKGSRASSRGPSSDGGRAPKQTTKAAPNVKVGSHSTVCIGPKTRAWGGSHVHIFCTLNGVLFLYFCDAACWSTQKGCAVLGCN